MSTSGVQNRYCLPVIKSTSGEVQALIEQQVSHFQYFEIWLDYIEDVTPHFMDFLVRSYPGRLIIILRRGQFEPERLSVTARMEILRALSGKDVLVDFDIFHQAVELERVTRNGIALKTILSYHNYILTPDHNELRLIAEKIQGAGAHITKVSTFCSNEHDALRLMSLLLYLREAKRRCVVLGMGSHGVMTRIFGLSWGNVLVFAPVTAQDSSAPGQIPLDKLELILQTLELHAKDTA